MSELRLNNLNAKTILIMVSVLVAVAIFVLYSPALRNDIFSRDTLSFDSSVTPAEQAQIQASIKNQKLSYKGQVQISGEVKKLLTYGDITLEAYVPVTSFNSVMQSLDSAKLAGQKIYITNHDSNFRQAAAQQLGLKTEDLQIYTGQLTAISESQIVFVPVEQLTSQLKLLSLDGHYYLDELTEGALFRTVKITSGQIEQAQKLASATLPTANSTLKINMTGVTALTRVMMEKLAIVKDPQYFSKNIGDFLANADLTHVSNEVSFKTGCQFSRTSFCAPPEMVDALKASGVDLVELTGNHGNDGGSQYNTLTINLYHQLGWQTFGGGLDAAAAAVPATTQLKNSKITFLGYNDADSPTSGVLASSDHAGGNSFSAAKAKADIVAAKAQGRFVIVDVQFLECYSYPDGFVEYPLCDKPIPNQTETFKSLIDDGADMVIGTQAHQPQTYELYEGRPIFYGLGNLYFDQTNWPGTERGIILTHYFVNGKYLQTKLTPTIFGQELQTHIANPAESTYLLQRLHDARIN